MEILSVSWLGGWLCGGPVVGGFCLIVKVFQKSEPGVMAEEVSCVRNLDAGCPSPSYFSLGSCTKSCDVIGNSINSSFMQGSGKGWGKSGHRA